MGGEKVMVRFKNPCSLIFTGTDLEEYGPFDEGDIVRLPEDNFKVLNDLGFVEKVGG